MAKKPPTPAQLAARAKFAEASRKRAADRKAEKENVTLPDRAPSEEPKTTISQQEYMELLQQIQELKNAAWAPQLPQLASQVGIRNGSLIGSVEKFDLNPLSYPDPRERLAQEQRLSRFAFPLNYELNWEVATTSYETIDGIRTKEPMFKLELVRIIVDEDTGEATNGRYIVCRLLMHEDPDAALVIAREQGIEVNETSEREFLDEMRYLRMKDWLLECFYPAPIKTSHKKKEVSIGGTLVEYYEITSENEEKIPFDKINKARKL